MPALHVQRPSNLLNRRLTSGNHMWSPKRFGKRKEASPKAAAAPLQPPLTAGGSIPQQPMLRNEVIEFVYGRNADLYNDVLGVSRSASQAEIQEAFFYLRYEIYQLLEQNGGGGDQGAGGGTGGATMTASQRNFVEMKMDAVATAFRILSDPSARAEYDDVLASRERAQSPASAPGAQQTSPQQASHIDLLEAPSRTESMDEPPSRDRNQTAVTPSPHRSASHGTKALVSGSASTDGKSYDDDEREIQTANPITPSPQRESLPPHQRQGGSLRTTRPSRKTRGTTAIKITINGNDTPRRSPIVNDDQTNSAEGEAAAAAARRGGRGGGKGEPQRGNARDRGGGSSSRRGAVDDAYNYYSDEPTEDDTYYDDKEEDDYDDGDTFEDDGTLQDDDATFDSAYTEQTESPPRQKDAAAKGERTRTVTFNEDSFTQDDATVDTLDDNGGRRRGGGRYRDRRKRRSASKRGTVDDDDDAESMATAQASKPLCVSGGGAVSTDTFCGAMTTRIDQAVEATTEEIKGSIQDTVLAMDQVWHAFTLKDEDIDAVADKLQMAQEDLTH